MEMIKKFFKDEEGATAVEYGLMVALIAMAIVGTVGLLGDKLNSLFSAVNSVLVNNTPSQDVTRKPREASDQQWSDAFFFDNSHHLF